MLPLEFTISDKRSDRFGSDGLDYDQIMKINLLVTSVLTNI
jgi:hypothetical protein